MQGEFNARRFDTEARVEFEFWYDKKTDTIE